MRVGTATARGVRARHARASRARGAVTRAHRPDAFVVTGGLGFIGAHLCAALASSGRVYAVDDLDARGPYPRSHKTANEARLRALGVSVVVADVANDADAFEAVVREASASASAEGGGGCVAVAHLAARSGVGAANDDPAGATRANVETTAVVLATAARVKDVARVVIASSGSVYGEASMTDDGAPRASVVGDSTDSPVSAYAATKRAAELLGKVFAESGGVSVVVTRIFTVYGPRGRPDMAVWRFIKQLSDGNKLTRFGDGNSTWRDYVYVDDVVDALIRALTCDIESKFSIVNVAGGAPVYLSDIIGAVEEACGKSGAVEETPGRPGDVGGTYGDVSCAKKLLGWRPMTPLAEGLARTVAWWRSDDANDYRDPS